MRVYLGLDGDYQVQLGQIDYKDIPEAVNNLLLDESTHVIWEPLNAAIFLGHVVIRKGGTDSNDILDVVIIPASEKGAGAGTAPSNNLQSIPFQIPNPVSGDKILIRGQLSVNILINEFFFLRELGTGSVDWEIRTDPDFNVTGTLIDSGNVSSGTTGTLFPLDPPVEVPSGNNLWVVYPTVSGQPEFIHGEIRTTT